MIANVPGLVRKIEIIEGGDSEFKGVRFYDEHGKIILKAGGQVGFMQEIILAPGERIIGVKSNLKGGFGSGFSPR
jgi:hypothetical protein